MRVEPRLTVPVEPKAIKAFHVHPSNRDKSEGAESYISVLLCTAFFGNVRAK